MGDVGITCLWCDGGIVVITGISGGGAEGAVDGAKLVIRPTSCPQNIPTWAYTQPSIHVPLNNINQYFHHHTSHHQYNSDRTS